MGNSLELANRHGDIERGYVCDDLREMYPTWYPKEIKGFTYAMEIKRLVSTCGFKAEVYYSPWDKKYLVFGVNDMGFRWLLTTALELDQRIVEKIRFSLWTTKNPISHLKRLRRIKRDKKIKAARASYDDSVYRSNQGVRLIRGLNRLIGGGGGKISQPFGSAETKRSLKAGGYNGL